MKEFEKTPGEDLDYGWDADEWLNPGDSIVSVVFDRPAGITLFAQSHNATECVGWFRGGEIGKAYIVVVSITTADGRKAQRSFKIRIVPFRSE